MRCRQNTNSNILYDPPVILLSTHIPSNQDEQYFFHAYEVRIQEFVK